MNRRDSQAVARWWDTEGKQPHQPDYLNLTDDEKDHAHTMYAIMHDLEWSVERLDSYESHHATSTAFGILTFLLLLLLSLYMIIFHAKL